MWAQVVWLFFVYERPPEYSLHHDLAGDRLVQWQRRAFPFLAVANFLVPLAFYPLFGWNSVLIAGALRTAALMTATGFVNSVCHKWGSRATDSRGHEYRADDSRNNWFVAVVAGGEGNHSWHHADPACPRHGRKVALDAQALAAGIKPTAAGAPTPPGGSSSSCQARPDLQGEKPENNGPLRRQATGAQQTPPPDPPPMAHQRATGSAGTPCSVTHRPPTPEEAHPFTERR